MRFYRSTTQYPVYTHTSWNVQSKGRDFHAALHLKHAFGGGGFYFGPRIEFAFQRKTDEVRKFLKEMRDIQYLVICLGCDREEWSKQLDDWMSLGMRGYVCPDCRTSKTLAEIDG